MSEETVVQEAVSGKLETSAPVVARVKVNDKEYVFDPSDFKGRQELAVMKVLVKAGYQDKVAEMASLAIGAPQENTEVAEMANQIDTSKAIHILIQIETAFVEKDLFEELISHLLVPVGSKYGPDTVKEIRELVFPELTFDQMRSIASHFFTSKGSLDKLIPNYLNQLKPLN